MSAGSDVADGAEAAAATTDAAATAQRPQHFQRIHDSLTRAYEAPLVLAPIVAPHGVAPGAEFVPVPENLDSPWDKRSRLASGEFAAYYGVHTRMLPYDHYSDDRLETFKTIQEYLNTRPPTRERVSRLKLRGESVLDSENCGLPLHAMCLLAGWWPGSSAPSSGTHWMNPNYCHDHDPAYCYTTPRERVDIAPRAAALYLSAEDLALMFGLGSKNGVRRQLSRYGYPWGPLRKAGRRRLARTVKTIHAWGEPWQRIADAIGQPRSTVATWATEWASEFTPPPDPNVEGFEDAFLDWSAERQKRIDRREVAAPPSAHDWGGEIR